MICPFIAVLFITKKNIREKILTNIDMYTQIDLAHNCDDDRLHVCRVQSSKSPFQVFALH